MSTINKKTTAAAKRKPVVRFWAVETISGDHEGFTKKADFIAFQRDFGDIITQTSTFCTKKAMDAFLAKQVVIKKHKEATAQKGDDVLVIESPSKGMDMSPSDRSIVERAQQRVAQFRPQNTIVVFWKTTTHSWEMAGPICLMDYYGGHVWSGKPKQLVSTIKACYYTEKDSENPHPILVPSEPYLCEAIENLDTKRMRDITSRDPNCIKKNAWQPKKGEDGVKKEVQYFEQDVIVYRIPIPVRELSSLEEETDWCNNAATSLGNYFKKVMCSQLFLDVHKTTVGNDRFWHSITNKKNGIVEYASSAIVKAEKLDMFTSHIIQKDAQDLVGALYKARQKTIKYQTPETATENETGNSGSPMSLETNSNGSVENLLQLRYFYVDLFSHRYVSCRSPNSVMETGSTTNVTPVKRSLNDSLDTADDDDEANPAEEENKTARIETNKENGEDSDDESNED